MRVVPVLDVLQERHAGAGAAQVDDPVQQLSVERRPEALGERIVVGVAGAASTERQVVFTRRLRRRPWMPSCGMTTGELSRPYS